MEILNPKAFGRSPGFGRITYAAKPIILVILRLSDVGVLPVSWLLETAASSAACRQPTNSNMLLRFCCAVSSLLVYTYSLQCVREKPV